MQHFEFENLDSGRRTLNLVLHEVCISVLFMPFLIAVGCYEITSATAVEDSRVYTADVNLRGKLKS